MIVISAKTIIVLRLYPISIDLIISQKYTSVFSEIQPHPTKRAWTFSSGTLKHRGVFRTYGLKISTTVESVYPYISVYLNVLR